MFRYTNRQVNAMKRLTWLFTIVLALSAIGAAHATGDNDSRSVTGAATGTFAAGAALGAVSLHGVELGTGVFIELDGSASGTFHAVLQGSSLGSPQELTIEGKVTEGSVGSDGRATFSGTASFDFGDGMPPLPGIPFSVTAGADGVVLVINSTTLPAAGLDSGAVTID
jgi:hypothetical protein